MTDYYEILGVERSATIGVIKEAYRRLVKQERPDLGETDTRRFLEIQEAYEILSGRPVRGRTDLRAVYDLYPDNPEEGTRAVKRSIAIGATTFADEQLYADIYYRKKSNDEALRRKEKLDHDIQEEERIINDIMYRNIIQKQELFERIGIKDYFDTVYPAAAYPQYGGGRFSTSGLITCVQKLTGLYNEFEARLRIGSLVDQAKAELGIATRPWLKSIFNVGHEEQALATLALAVFGIRKHSSLTRAELVAAAHFCDQHAFDIDWLTELRKGTGGIGSPIIGLLDKHAQITWSSLSCTQNQLADYLKRLEAVLIQHLMPYGITASEIPLFLEYPPERIFQSQLQKLALVLHFVHQHMTSLPKMNKDEFRKLACHIAEQYKLKITGPFDPRDAHPPSPVEAIFGVSASPKLPEAHGNKHGSSALTYRQ